MGWLTDLGLRVALPLHPHSASGICTAAAAAADNYGLHSKAQKHTTLRQTVVPWFHTPEPVRITAEAPCRGRKDDSLFLSITASELLTSFTLWNVNLSKLITTCVLKLSQQTTDSLKKSNQSIDMHWNKGIAATNLSQSDSQSLRGKDLQLSERLKGKC